MELELTVIACDVVAVVTAFGLYHHYGRHLRLGHNRLYRVYFWAVAWIAGYMTISDIYVVAGFKSPWWLPVVRVMVFRVPHTLVMVWLLWSLKRQR